MEFNKFEDSSYNIIGSKLKLVREKLNISQDKLSNQLSLLGITLYQSDIFKIEQQDIEKSEIDIIEKTLNNIENYLFTKQKMQVEINDYEYLKNIAETLRNQKVRIEDNVILGQPVFRIMVGEEEIIYFITREGARKFIETHSTIFDKNIDNKDQENQVERRKDDLMEVTTNKNLEISKILEIIKRNY